jgi:Ca-activated chloride channel homolog
MTAKEMDVRLSRRAIERYEWPLAFAALSLALSLLLKERKRVRARSFAPTPVSLAPAATAILLLLATSAFGTVGGINFYHDGKYADAYEAFQQDLKDHPDSPEKPKMEFDAGTAAYYMKSYEKAAEAFSQALLSTDTKLQSKSHYNLGNTLYRRGESLTNDTKKLTDWTNALQHYEETLKLEPTNVEARENYEFVKKKIEELKNKPHPTTTPTPPPKKPTQPSEAAKRAKAEADNAVRRRQYEKAYDIMTKQLSVDPSTFYYGDYIQRLENINGIKKSVVVP